MVTKEQIEKANETARKAFEATKRIYDLAFIALEKINNALRDRKGPKPELISGTQDKRILTRYGQLSPSEKEILKRYRALYIPSSISRETEVGIANKQKTKVQFVLFSIATRDFKEPMLIYGDLQNLEWIGNTKYSDKDKIESFMYEISEKREEVYNKMIEVPGKTLAEKGSAKAIFESKSLFSITNETLPDLIDEIIKYFEK